MDAAGTTWTSSLQEGSTRNTQSPWLVVGLHLHPPLVAKVAPPTVEAVAVVAAVMEFQ